MRRCVWSRNLKNEVAMTRVRSQQHSQKEKLLSIHNRIWLYISNFCPCFKGFLFHDTATRFGKLQTTVRETVALVVTKIKKICLISSMLYISYIGIFQVPSVAGDSGLSVLWHLVDWVFPDVQNELHDVIFRGSHLRLVREDGSNIMLRNTASCLHQQHISEDLGVFMSDTDRDMSVSPKEILSFVPTNVVRIWFWKSKCIIWACSAYGGG